MHTLRIERAHAVHTAGGHMMVSAVQNVVNYADAFSSEMSSPPSWTTSNCKESTSMKS